MTNRIHHQLIQSSSIHHRLTKGSSPVFLRVDSATVNKFSKLFYTHGDHRGRPFARFPGKIRASICVYIYNISRIRWRTSFLGGRNRDSRLSNNSCNSAFPRIISQWKIRPTRDWWCPVLVQTDRPERALHTIDISQALSAPLPTSQRRVSSFSWSQNARFIRFFRDFHFYFYFQSID